MQNLENFYGPNAGYVLELFERYQQDPASVDATTRAIFEHWTPEEPVSANGASTVQPRQTRTSPLQQSVLSSPTVTHEDTPAYSPSQVAKIVAASTLAHAIRERGHLGAHLDPLGSAPLGDPALDGRGCRRRLDGRRSRQDRTALSPARCGLGCRTQVLSARK